MQRAAVDLGWTVWGCFEGPRGCRGRMKVGPCSKGEEWCGAPFLPPHPLAFLGLRRSGGKNDVEQEGVFSERKRRRRQYPSVDQTPKNAVGEALHENEKKERKHAKRRMYQFSVDSRGGRGERGEIRKFGTSISVAVEEREIVWGEAVFRISWVLVGEQMGSWQFVWWGRRLPTPPRGKLAAANSARTKGGGPTSYGRPTCGGKS